MPDPDHPEAQRLAALLGGGWRIEHGVMPLVTLTLREAQALEARLLAESNVLDCPMGDNDADAATVRGYLMALLRGVWVEGEGFNGKRPFGNSSWEHEVYTALLKAGLVTGTLDEDGYIEDVDDEAADKLVLAAIERLGGSSG